jgi:proteasome lid subunit RPN8/RPN11
MPVLVIRKKFLTEMVAHALKGYPLEACGLLAGTASEDFNAEVHSVYPTDNVAASARVYEVDPKAMLRADREAEAVGDQLIGVYHSHTHTDAKPSPTDITQAPDPGWHYVVVSLRDEHPSVRSWAIRDGKTEEETVVVE